MIIRLFACLLFCLFAAAATAASPAIEAALSLPRTEPRHYVETAIALANLGADAQAEQIAQEFAALSPSDDALVELVDSVGSAALLSIATRFPETGPLVEKAMAAAAANAGSEERLDALLGRLTAGDLAQQQRVLRELRRTGSTGVSFLLTKLASARDAQAEARIREALVALAPESLPALMTATASDDPAVATQASYAIGRLAQLGRLDATLPATMLLRSALTRDDAVGKAARWSYMQAHSTLPDRAVAAAIIDRAIDTLDRGGLQLPVSPGNAYALLGYSGLPSDVVTDAFLAQLAADHAALAPADLASQRRAALLAAEAGDLRPQQSVTLDKFSAGELQKMLRTALEKSYDGAAATICAEFVRRNDADVLVGMEGRPTPLATALKNPSPLVRYAALSAVMRLEPQTPFAGSSAVADALAYFAAARGARRAIVAAPTLAYASEVAGMLPAAGYSARPVNSGTELIEQVGGSPDIELLLIDLAVVRPAIRETLFRLRRMPAGGTLPIAIMAPDGRLLEAQNLAAEHDGAVIAVPRVRETQSAVSLAERLAGLGIATPAATRRDRAVQATEWIAQIAERGPKFYELRNSIPQLTAALPAGTQPTATLASLGDAESQQRLAAQAGNASLPIGNRRAAAEAFSESVERYGLLLTETQVLRQYNLYNNSATADSETQKLLGSVLDAIETRRPAGVVAAP